MAQISRALSTSLRFDPLSGIIDGIKEACRIVSSHSSTRRGTQEPEEGRRLKREKAGKSWNACRQLLDQTPKFLQLRLALVPQIPSHWLNRGFQAWPDQWEGRDEGPSVWPFAACLLSCCCCCRWGLSLPLQNTVKTPQLGRRGGC